MFTSTILRSLVTLGALIPFTQAQLTTIPCNASISCPESAPCCSQYGVCGTGSTCLGGCLPAWSFSKDACMPMPVCKDVETRFKSFDDVLVTTEYLGNPDDSDWIYSGWILNNESQDDDDKALLITMPKESGGSVLSSTRYVWYGKVSATLKTSRGAGVVGSFILYSNAQDEIDWEYVGYNLSSVQTNYYSQGVLNWKNMIEGPVISNTFEEYHTYEMDWTEEAITWSIDGNAVRTLKKSDTYDAATGKYAFPQTPSRVQFSLWPAGQASNAPGTVEWAGGNIDWDSEDMQEKGYYYLTLKDASIQCYDPPSVADVQGSKAYVFTDDTNFTEEFVAITDDDTVLGSQDATGLNPDEGASSSSSSESSKESSSSSSSSSEESSSSSSSSEESSSSSSSSSSEESSSSSSSSSSQSRSSSSRVSSSSSSASSSSVRSSSQFVQATSTRSVASSSSQPSTTPATNTPANAGNVSVKSSFSSMLIIALASFLI